MDDYNTPAPVGHNQPPPDLDPLEIAKAAIDAALLPIIPRLETRLASAGRAKIDNLEDARKVTDLVALLSTSEGSINRAHSETKAIYLDCGRVVDGRAAEWRDKIGDERKRLNTMLTTFQQAEAAKVKALREAERAAEQQDPEPTATSHEAVDRSLATVRGDFGASSKLAEVLVIQSVDVKKLPKAFLNRPKILAIIEAEAKVVIKAGGTVTGVVSGKTSEARVRKGG